MKISILLPTYNHEPYLQKCLTQIHKQSYQNYEILVYNDGSTDNTKKILERFQKQDKKYKVFTGKKNQGVERCLKTLLKKISGDLIFGVASDDFLVSDNFFQKTVAILSQNPTLAGVFARTEIRTPDLKKKLWVMGNCGVHGILTPDVVVERFFKRDFFVPGSSSIWRTKCFFDAGGFDKRLGPQCDYYINHVLPMKYGVYFLDETVAVMRKSGESLSSTIKNQSFFNNHALFEKKAKVFLENAAPSDQQWRHWRNSVINSRLNIELNAYLFKRLEEAFARIHEWEKDALAPYLKEIFELFQKEAKPFKILINKQEKQAHAIFNKLAGFAGDLPADSIEFAESSFGKKVFKKLKSFFRQD
jgi:glycosyltransferase involved in cell wall biosynthesis